MTRAREIQSARVALSGTACDRACAVRAAADDFVQSHLPLVTVRQAAAGIRAASQVLNIAWIAEALDSPASVICPRSGACPRQPQGCV